MKIDLRKELSDHFTRLRNLAEEAEEDSEEKYSSRAAAMSALTRLIDDLTQAQEKVINMERLMRIESTVIEVVNDFLSLDQKEKFLTALEGRLQEFDS